MNALVIIAIALTCIWAYGKHSGRRLRERRQYALDADKRAAERVAQLEQTPPRRFVTVLEFSPAQRRHAMHVVNRGPKGAA